jgi:hypothetical protein
MTTAKKPAAVSLWRMLFALGFPFKRVSYFFAHFRQSPKFQPVARPQIFAIPKMPAGLRMRFWSQVSFIVAFAIFSGPRPVPDSG